MDACTIFVRAWPDIEIEFLLTPQQVREFKKIKGFTEYILSVYKGHRNRSWPDMDFDLGGSYKGKNDKIGWLLSDDGSSDNDYNEQCLWDPAPSRPYPGRVHPTFASQFRLGFREKYP